MKKNAAIFLLIVSALITLASCSAEKDSEKILSITKGRMDSIYFGTTEEEYLELSGLTVEDVAENYNANIRREAVYFASYTGIIDAQDDALYDALPEATRTKLENMYKSVYKLATYEIRDPEKEDDGTYSVEIVAEQIGVIEDSINTILAGEYEPYKEFVAKYNTVPGSADTFSQDLTDVLVDLVNSKISSVQSTQKSKTFLINILEDEEGNFSVNPDDWTPVDKFIILYP